MNHHYSSFSFFFLKGYQKIDQTKLKEKEAKNKRKNKKRERKRIIQTGRTEEKTKKKKQREKKRNIFAFFCIYPILIERSVATAKVLLASPSLLGKRYFPIQDQMSILRMF